MNESIINNKIHIESELLNYYKKQLFMMNYEKDNFIKAVKTIKKSIDISKNLYFKGYLDALTDILKFFKEEE